MEQEGLSSTQRRDHPRSGDADTARCEAMRPDPMGRHPEIARHRGSRWRKEIGAKGPNSQQVQRTRPAPLMQVGQGSIHFCPASQPPPRDPQGFQVGHDPAAPRKHLNGRSNRHRSAFHQGGDPQGRATHLDSILHDPKTKLCFQDVSEQGVGRDHHPVGNRRPVAQSREQRGQRRVAGDEGSGHDGCDSGASGAQTRGAGETFFGGILEEQSATSLL